MGIRLRRIDHPVNAENHFGQIAVYPLSLFIERIRFPNGMTGRIPALRTQTFIDQNPAEL